MNTHLLLLGLGLASLFTGFNLGKLRLLSIKGEFWTLVFGLIIISVLGLVSAYALSLPAKEFQNLFDQSLFGFLLIIGLFVIIWALPFFVNYKDAAATFTTIILLITFSLGSAYCSQDLLPLIVVSISFIIGITAKWISKYMIPKN